MKKKLLIIPILIIFLLSINLQNTIATEVPLQIQSVEVVKIESMKLNSITTAIGHYYGILGAIGVVGEDLYLTVNAPNASAVKMEVTTSQGDKSFGFNKYDSEFNYYKRLEDNDTGMITVNKIIAYDIEGNSIEKICTDLKFYIIPKNYKIHKYEFLGINNNYNGIDISLSKEADPTTINPNTIEMFESNGQVGFYLDSEEPSTLKKVNNLELKVSNDKKSFKIKKNTPYEINKRYHVIINNTVKDLEGNSLENPKWINFIYVDSQDKPGEVQIPLD